VRLVVNDEDPSVHEITIEGRPGRARPDRP
jgi:hypothetical protein